MNAPAALTLAWGRCYSVVTAGLEYASECLDELDGDPLALRELEAMFSPRAEARARLLGSPRGRPVGPYSSVALDALAIGAAQAARGDVALPGSPGWSCHLRERDAVDHALARHTRFLSASGAQTLEMTLQVYSLRLGGRFAPFSLELTTMASEDLIAAGIDGILHEGAAPGSGTALVVRGGAVSQIRPLRQILLRWDGKQVSIAGEAPQPHPALQSVAPFAQIGAARE